MTDAEQNQDAEIDPWTSPQVVDATVIDEERPGQPWLAWSVIVSIIALMVALPYLPIREEPPAATTGLTEQIFGVYGKVFVAAAEMQTDDRGQLYDAAKIINTGPLQQRLWFITVAGDLAGPAEAQNQLANVEARLGNSKLPHDPAALKAMGLLRRTYEDYASEKWHAPSLSAADRQFLTQELDWFGSLALAPKVDGQTSAEREAVLAPARQTARVVTAATLLLVIIGLAGLGGFIAFVVLPIMGKIRSGLSLASRNGGLYVESFAVWQVLFVLLSLAAVILWRGNPMLPGGIALAVSGIAVAWPTRRGVKWSQVRQDIGLTRGKGVVELAWGFVCYISSLPLLMIGLLMVLGLMSLAGALSDAPPLDEFANPTGPAHPLVDWLSGATALVWLQAFLLACVIAPVVEETMFRGVLYRHLREATAKWRIGFSVAASALFNSLIFAAIHPQGWVGIPLLMSLAVGFSLAREWRGSLIAPITMHALNNGIVLGVLFLLSL